MVLGAERVLELLLLGVFGEVLNTFEQDFVLFFFDSELIFEGSLFVD